MATPMEGRMSSGKYYKKSNDKRSSGFTLLEVMVVVAIIAILAAMALPSYDSRIVRSQIIESAELFKQLKENVNTYYLREKEFPKNNHQADIPEPDKLLGNYVKRVDLADGAYHIVFGNKAHSKLKDKILTLRPLVVK
ncbi:MAG: prepilin-type N-terminal cleavage/methylation domain-containing protein, partial [Moraxellaceae bacterium]